MADQTRRLDEIVNSRHLADKDLATTAIMSCGRNLRRLRAAAPFYSSLLLLLFCFLFLLGCFLCGVLVLDGNDLAGHRVDVDFRHVSLRCGNVERVDEFPFLVLELLARDFARSLLERRGAG